MDTSPFHHWALVRPVAGAPKTHGTCIARSMEKARRTFEDRRDGKPLPLRWSIVDRGPLDAPKATGGYVTPAAPEPFHEGDRVEMVNPEGANPVGTPGKVTGVAMTWVEVTWEGDPAGPRNYRIDDAPKWFRKVATPKPPPAPKNIQEILAAIAHPAINPGPLTLYTLTPDQAAALHDRMENMAANGNALEAIATICKVPEGRSPGALVRDVEGIVAQLNNMRASTQDTMDENARIKAESAGRLPIIETQRNRIGALEVQADQDRVTIMGLRRNLAAALDERNGAEAKLDDLRALRRVMKMVEAHDPEAGDWSFADFMDTVLA